MSERMSDFRFAALTRWFSVEEIPTKELPTTPTDNEIFNALKAERVALKAAEAKLKAASKQLISCHRFACTPNNCMLDGGTEHEAAFIEEQTK